LRRRLLAFVAHLRIGSSLRGELPKVPDLPDLA
jgi:hypothetical protein